MRHGALVIEAIFSGDDTRILSWGDSSIRVWNAHSGEPIGAPMYDWVYGAIFSRDQNRILSWGGDTVQLWDAQSDSGSGHP